MAVGRPRPPAAQAESVAVLVFKVVMILAAAGLMLQPLATTGGMIAAFVGIIGAAWLARRLHLKRIRLVAGVAIGLAVCAVAWLVSDWMLATTPIASAVGVDGAIMASDIVFFGGALGALLFVIRLAAQRKRVVSIVEAALIVTSVVYTFAKHRGYHLNQPRFFNDWALREGLDPTVILMVMGVAVTVFALIMFMRRQDGAKTAVSMVLAIGVSIGVYFLIEDRRVDPEILTNGLGLLGDKDNDGKPDENDKDGDGKPDKDGDKGGQGGSGSNDGPQGGGGSGDSPYQDNYDRNDEPQPVAVVAFHDDYESKDGILYFRQQVQSSFNQTHLAVDSTNTYDTDVIEAFPTTGPIQAGPTQNLDVHEAVPTSVFLLADHPQPVALTHATEIRPLDNPNPRVFVAAYGVTSHVLSVDYSRLLGRRSVPADWSDEKRAHYLQIPDDPRYEALSDILVRDLDPRFADDDLMKALVIKRYLEQKGFYTRKETHTDAVDPTASFLFGSLRGYCVHFAHSAAFLFRSQGIASRVAVGYGADTRKRSGGSNLLIYGEQAHAWPEIHVEGIGWVTFDIYPEQSDEVPAEVVDQDLESLLGEMARKDPSGGRAEDPDAAGIAWGLIGWIALLAVLGVLALAYIIKWYRRLMPRFVPAPKAHRWLLRAALDRWSDVGEWRDVGETRERFADRMAQVTPALRPLTMAHLRHALGRPGSADDGADVGVMRDLYAQHATQYRKQLPLKRRLAGALNPIGWVFTR